MSSNKPALLRQHFPLLSGKKKLRISQQRWRKCKRFAGRALANHPCLSPCSKVCPVMTQHIELSTEPGMLVPLAGRSGWFPPFPCSIPCKSPSKAFSLPDPHGTQVPGLSRWVGSSSHGDQSGKHVCWELLSTSLTGLARKLSSPGLVGLGVSEWFGSTLRSRIFHGGKKKKRESSVIYMLR